MEPTPTDDSLLAPYAEPEAVFRPSSGQTFAGVVVMLGVAVVGFLAAAFGEGIGAWNRWGGAGFAIGGLVFAWYIFRLRKWRLVILTGGVVQIRATGVDTVAWSDVYEVLETRYGTVTGCIQSITLRGPQRTVVIEPINLRSRLKLFQALKDAATKRSIPIRVEVQETS